MDLPGLGRSSKVPGGLHDIDSVAAQIEELRIQHRIERWHVVGHDAGSAIAVRYVHRFPEKVGRLALLSRALFPELRPFYLFQLLRKPVVGELLAPFVSFAFWHVAMRYAIDPSDGERQVPVRDFQTPFAGLFGAWRLMSILRWGEPAQVLASMPLLLPQVGTPTMIFHGSRDPAVPEDFARRASALLPNCELVVLDDGHFIPLNSSERVAAGLLRFFNSQ